MLEVYLKDTTKKQKWVINNERLHETDVIIHRYPFINEDITMIYTKSSTTILVYL